MKRKLNIIFEDDSIVVVNKPPKFLTIPDRYATHIPNLYHQLNKRFGKVYIVHRLDRETSGILVFAKTETAHKKLCQQFEKRTSRKIYYAFVEGILHVEQGVIDKAIVPSPTQKGRMIIAKKGKASVTHFKLVEQFRQFALVAADIKTGRTHQIRVHFEAIGYPLMVDAIYGSRKEFFLSEIKHRKYRLGKNQEERALLSRTALHAYALELEHPVTNERMEFTADLPKDMAAVLKQLRKWGM